MIKIILILVYMWSGELKVERVPFSDQAACEAAGNKIVAAQYLDPKFEEGLYAACVSSKVTEV